ncbi:cysteine-rich repeat secretory protein 55 [Quercus suber]|uniref:Cysteine-rich repeat secretory protein 55 n=1 Tax=Quercus suber TaxID=58331 RepID=A0AAW0IFN5_QUESU
MTWFPKLPPTSYGKNQDQVFGLGQCRGDVSSKDCSSCIQDAAKQIRQCCPNQADARIWYDHCFLRYNNKSFIGEIDTSFDRKGCRVLYGSCYVRYELYPFFFPLDSKSNITMADTLMAIVYP